MLCSALCSVTEFQSRVEIHLHRMQRSLEALENISCFLLVPILTNCAVPSIDCTVHKVGQHESSPKLKPKYLLMAGHSLGHRPLTFNDSGLEMG